MHRGHGRYVGRPGHDLAPLPGHPEPGSQQSLGCRSSEAQHDLGMHGIQFGQEPRFARGHLTSAGLLVEPHLAPWLPFEVLYRVGHVQRGTLQAGLFQGLIEEGAGRTHKGFPGQILFVTGLFPHHHHRSLRVPIAEHRLGGVLVQVAGLAPGTGLAQRFEVVAIGRKELAGVHGCCLPRSCAVNPSLVRGLLVGPEPAAFPPLVPGHG